MLEQTLSLFVLTRRDSYSSWDEWKYNARAHFSRRHMNNYGRMAAVTPNFSHANFQNIFINDFFCVCVSKQPVLAKSLFCKVPVLAKSLLWQRACSGIFLKLFAWSIFLTQRWLKSFTNNRAGTLTTFFGVCYRSCILLVCLFVVFFNFLQCFFFFFVFVFFFLLVLSLLGSLFRFFSPPFCLLVYLFCFGYFLFIRFVLFCFWFCFLFSFLSR